MSNRYPTDFAAPTFGIKPYSTYQKGLVNVGRIDSQGDDAHHLEVQFTSHGQTVEYELIPLCNETMPDSLAERLEHFKGRSVRVRAYIAARKPEGIRDYIISPDRVDEFMAKAAEYWRAAENNEAAVVAYAAFTLRNDHVYSDAPEAGWKQSFDQDYLQKSFKARPGRGDVIDLRNEDYVKELIRTRSNGRSAVSGLASGLQFYIIRGGGEGFLNGIYAGRDASRFHVGGTTTSGGSGWTMVCEDNGLLVAFDQAGKLMNAVVIRRPLSIRTSSKPTFWTESTATKVFDAWDGRPVSMYHNTNPHYPVHYYGLWVDDAAYYYRGGEYGRVNIDIHKFEATNGCILIVDTTTPPYSDPVRLTAFEPKFITDIQARIGAKERYNIGTMHLVGV